MIVEHLDQEAGQVMADCLVPNPWPAPHSLRYAACGTLPSFGQRNNPEDQSLRFGVEQSRIGGEHDNLPFGDVVVVGPYRQALKDGADVGCAGLRSDAYRRRACSCVQQGLEPGRTQAEGARLAGAREHGDSDEGHGRSQVGGREQKGRSQTAVPRV